jgi:hypothetical protein
MPRHRRQSEEDPSDELPKRPCRRAIFHFQEAGALIVDRVFKMLFS